MSGLTEEQRAVSEAPVGARQLVIAGPGTGKTHTLVARLAHLVEEEEVFSGAVLALSFSRAAVNELRRRLRASGDDASRIVPVTFDSFATRILANVDPDGEWTTKSFDGRIEAAIGKKAIIEMTGMQPGDVTATYADITAINRDHGFEPTVPIEVGIPRFVDWYSSYKGLG